MASAAPAVRASKPSLPAPAGGLRRLAAKAVGDAAHVDLDPPDPETKLVALARAAAPLRRALAKLAGRMEALRGWERIGWPRRRDYAIERLGISGRQLEALAHMDRAFAGLEAVERAFVSGRIPWTKARLLARVASAQDAERWIAHATAIPARELSREVRAVDARAHDLLRPETDEEGESEGEAKETVLLHCEPAVRAKWHRARFLASRLEGPPGARLDGGGAARRGGALGDSLRRGGAPTHRGRDGGGWGGLGPGGGRIPCPRGARRALAAGIPKRVREPGLGNGTCVVGYRSGGRGRTHKRVRDPRVRKRRHGAG